MNFIESAPGVKLYYEDWGSGQPVVFIHGWPLSHEMFEYQMTQLPQQGLRCIAYDRRGFGKSSKTWEGYDYNTLADDLKALLEKLDLNDVTLVGFSMGGGEVARYFSRHGGARVSKVVLLGSVTPYMLQTDDNPNGVPREQFEQMAEKIKDDRPAFLADFSKVFFGVNLISHPVSQPYLAWCQMLTTLGSPKATLECLWSFAETDFRPDMKHIKVPTLIIHGDSDKTVPIEPTGQQAAKMIPDAKYIVYEGAPHGFFYTEKDKLNRDLVEFILEPSAIPFASPAAY